MEIPYVDLARQHVPLLRSLLANVERVLRHGQFINGPEVRVFEQALAEFLQVEYVVGVASGTAALTLALRAAGIGPGDEVITVSHSYVATASSIRLVGATPTFIDIDARTGLLDPTLLSEARTQRTKAVIPVHLGGSACNIKPIHEFCEAHGLDLIEDCAQSIGAKFAGRSVGTFGTGCFSLHPLKVLSACGDAGFITTQDARKAELLRKMRNLGLEDRDHVALLSENARLDTLQAAILIAKLPLLPSWIAARRAHADAYSMALAQAFELTAIPEGSDSVYSTYVIRTEARDALVEHLRAAGIDARVHYPVPIHRQPLFHASATPPLPQTERLVDRIVSLPVTPELDARGRDRVIEALLQWKRPDA